jgi:replicative DNA helicase
MDAERGLIGKIVLADGFADAQDYRVTTELFESKKYRAVFKFIKDFYEKYGEIPSVELLEEEFPEVDIPYAKEPAGYYIDKMRERHIRNKGAEILTSKAPLLVQKPIDGILSIREAVANLSIVANPTSDSEWGENVEERIKQYLAKKEMEGVTGYHTPWQPLDIMTSGIHAKEFICVVARPKTGKTFLLIILALAMWKQGLSVMFISTEMSKMKISQRLDAVNFELPYQEFKTGVLPDAFEERYKREIKKLKDKEPIHIVEDVDGVSSIGAKIDQYEPDVVFLDGMYLLNDDKGARSTWERVKNISNDLRKLAKTKDVPLVTSTQFNRGAENASSFKDVTLAQIGYADSIGQDAELVLGMFQDRDMRNNREMLIRTMAFREGEPVDFTIQWDLHNMDFKVLEVDDDDEYIDPEEFEEPPVDF